MSRNLECITWSAGFAAAMVLLVSASVEAKSDATLANEQECVPASVEKRVNECPKGIVMSAGKTKKKVGTTTKKVKAKTKKGPGGPGLDRKIVQDITESAFSKKRKVKQLQLIKKEIKLLLRLAKSTSDDDPEKAEILKRLADAFKDYYSQLNFMARGLEEKIFNCKKKKDKKCEAKLRGQQKALDDKAKLYREKAIKAYVEIRNKFQDYPNYDEILFAIAYEIDQLAVEVFEKKKKSAYKERARIFYKELIRNYPRSKFIPHAWMAFGEYYFHEALDVEKAMRSYEKVVEWGEEKNPNYIIAMYYQAWCLFNMQEFKKTINQFNKVIQYSDEHPNNKEAKVVAKRSKMEMVSPFSKIGNPNQAWQFFQRVGGELSFKMLDKLANLYYDDGHWSDAIIVFHQLQRLEIENYRGKGGDELCEYQRLITSATLASGSKDKQMEEMKRLIALSFKFSQEKHDKAKIKRCNSSAIALAWDEATKWHLEAVGSESSPGTKDENTMRLCISLYEEILKSYPDLDNMQVDGFDANTKPTRYRVAYYKAELYWHMNDWLNAAKAFGNVVEMNPKGEYSSDSAYAEVLCYNKIYVQERSETDKERKHKLKGESASGDSCDKKCQKCVAKCKKKKGEEKQSCIRACKDGAKVVLKTRPLTDLETGILKAYNRYICFVKKTDELVNIKYRRARIYYEANMFAEASVLFKDIAVNHSEDEVAVYAANLYLDSLNALGSTVENPIPSCYDDLADIVDVFIDTSKKPGSELMKDEEFAGQMKSLKVGVMRKKAESLNKRGRFKEAAQIYLDIFRNYSGVYNERGMCEVLFNTAINLEAARLVMSAIKVREKMIELYESCEHSKKAAFYIGQNYHALQSFSMAAENYVAFASKYPGEEEAPDAMANAVMFYIGLGKPDIALQTVEKFQKLYRKRHLQKTATVVFGGGQIHVNAKDWEKVNKWYNKYLKTYKSAKLYDEQVQANVLIADSYWHQKRPDYGKAIKYYNKAFATFKSNHEKVTENARKAAMLIAAAKAKYYIAERKFMEFVAVKFPEFKPDRNVPDKVEKWWKKKTPKDQQEAFYKWRKDRARLARWGYLEEGKPIREQIKMAKKEKRKEDLDKQFNFWAEDKLKPWLEKKAALLNEGVKLFAEVTTLHIPEWEMAAAARAGDMQLQFMKAIFDSPLPPSFKGDQELTDIYRGAMDKKAAPYHTGAVAAYAHCLNISTKVQWFNENSLRCENELNKLEPLKYPVSEEIRVHSDGKLEFWARPGVITDFETEAQKREKTLANGADAISSNK